MEWNKVSPGYVYHVKDTYFDAVKDERLMRNHERGAYRPTYYCLMDERTQLLWVIPMSSRVDKYQPFIEKDVDKYGICNKIYIGKYGNGKSVFLLQNMFPILPRFINHIHTIAGIPMPVNPEVVDEVLKRFREVRRLHSRGAKVVFPDIDRLERLMLAERDKENADD